MFSEQSAREQLAAVRDRLSKMDTERDILRDLEKTLVRWLDLHAGGNVPLPLAPEAPPKSGRIVGSIALKDAAIRALRNRAGNPMRTADILATAISMGASTKSDNPEKLLEWTLYDVIRKGSVPIKRIAPHLYEYTDTKLPIETASS